MKKDRRMLIITEKVATKDGRARKIIKFVRAIPTKDLPSEYLSSYPVVKVRGTYLECQQSAATCFSLIVGELYPETEFQTMLSYIREAGERLTRIRADIQNELEGWSEKGVAEAI